MMGALTKGRAPGLSSRKGFLLTGVRYAPDAAGAIVGNIKVAFTAYCYAYWAPPDLTIFGYEAGEEVFVTTLCVAVMHRDSDDFIAGTVGAVPGAVLGGEGVTVVAGRKLLLLDWIESHFQRGHVGLHEDIWGDYFCREIDAFAVSGLRIGEYRSLRVRSGAVNAWLRKPGILMAAHVVPRPAVKAALLYRSYVIWNKVVAQIVALVGGTPKLAGDGIDGFADAVSDAMRVNFDEFAIGRIFENICPVKFLGMGIGVIDI